MGNISLFSGTTYQLETLCDLMRRHFDALGLTAKELEGRPVVVKPNLVMRTDPQRGGVTHPLFLEALLLELRRLGTEKIVVADSPGGLYQPALLRAIFEGTGMWDAAERCGAICNTDVSVSMLSRSENRLCRTFSIIEPLARDAFVINLCKVKTHSMMNFTCGVKNLFGAVPGLEKAQMHYRFPQQAYFAQMLVDLALTITPDLTIADGIIGMEGDGPTAGTPIAFGVTAAALGADVFAMDLLLSSMCGFKPTEVPTAAECIQRGLCPTSPEQVNVVGETELREKAIAFRRPKSKSLDFLLNSVKPVAILSKAVQKWLTPRPVVNPKLCIGCEKCKEICPANTIRMQPLVDPGDRCVGCYGCGQCDKRRERILKNPRKAVILKENCIRCFCCHEVCPVQAINIRSLL